MYVVLTLFNAREDVMDYSELDNTQAKEGSTFYSQ